MAENELTAFLPVEQETAQAQPLGTENSGSGVGSESTDSPTQVPAEIDSEVILLEETPPVFADAEELRTNDKQARCIGPDNVYAVIDIIQTPKFKGFKSFIKTIYTLLEEIDSCCDDKKKEQEEIEGYEYINRDMKNKNKELYKKLMAKLFDSDPKQKKFQNVKIKKSLIRKLKNEFNIENPVIEDLVQLALNDYLKLREESKT